MRKKEEKGRERGRRKRKRGTLENVTCANVQESTHENPFYSLE